MTRVTHEGEVVEETALAVIPPAAIVKPAVSVQEALETWKSYEELKKKIITDDDIQTIGKRDFLKKSYWRKLGTFFNLSVEMIEEKRVSEEDGSLTYEVIYRATAPNGRTAIGDGTCNDEEKKERNGNPIKNSRHNTRGTAHTRAFNRAVSNLVGGGEVSAEEADQDTSNSSHDIPNGKSRASIPKPDTIGPEERKKLWDVANELGWTENEVRELLATYNYTRTPEIKKTDFEEIIKKLQS